MCLWRDDRLACGSDASCPENTQNVQIFPPAGFIWLFHQYQNKRSFVSFLLWNKHLLRMQRSWFNLYEWRAEEGWLFKTFVTHSGLVHDDTDTDCWAQTRQHPRSCFFATLKRRYLTNSTVNGVRNCCESVFFFRSYQQGPAMLLGPRSPLNTKYLYIIPSQGLTCCGPSTGSLMVTSFTTAPVSSHTFRSIFLTDPETPFNQPSEMLGPLTLNLMGSHTHSFSMFNHQSEMLSPLMLN